MVIKRTIIFLFILVLVHGGRECKNDRDCSEKQYCYDASGLCVNYTVCNRYNREEARQNARDPSQCGSCISGYTAEVLATRESAWICKRKSSITMGVVPWGVVAIVLLFFVGIITLYIFLRKHIRTETPTIDDNSCKELVNVGIGRPSAPPLENSPFMSPEESPSSSYVTNNNQNVKDKNQLVRATPFKGPDWIHVNPNYEQQLNNDSSNDQSLSLSLQLDEDTNPSSWTPSPSTAEESAQSFSQFVVEQHDNAVNAARIQRNYSLTFDVTPSDVENQNNGPSPESAEPQDHRNHSRTRNILIAQKVTMNINMLNGDC